MRTGLRKLTRDQRCNVATLYKFHWKLESIADHYGVHYTTIRRVLDEMGVYRGRYNIPVVEARELQEAMTA